MTVFATILILLFITAYVTSKWQKIAPKKFELTRHLDKLRVTVDDDVTVTTTMVNKKLTPLPWISVFTFMPPSFVFEGENSNALTADRMSEYKIVTSFLFYEQVKRHDKFNCTKRGYYKLEAPIITFGDLFGFSKAEKVYPTDVALYVYPKRLPLESFKLMPNSQQGAMSVKRWIMPDPIQAIGTRAYTHDDSFNMIDWKSSAKLGALQVKKMDHTSDASMMIYLDVQTSKMHWNEIDRNAIEKGVEVAASIVHDAFSQRIPTGFCANSVDAFMRNAVVIKPASVPNQKMQILDAIAMVTPFRGVPMERLIHEGALQFHSVSLFVIITPHLSDELILELNRMSKQTQKVKVILTKKAVNTSRLQRKIECIHVYEDAFYMSKDTEEKEEIRV